MVISERWKTDDISLFVKQSESKDIEPDGVIVIVKNDESVTGALDQIYPNRLE